MMQYLAGKEADEQGSISKAVDTQSDDSKPAEVQEDAAGKDGIEAKEARDADANLKAMFAEFLAQKLKDSRAYDKKKKSDEQSFFMAKALAEKEAYKKKKS